MGKNKRTKQLINDMKDNSGSVNINIDHLYIELQGHQNTDKFVEQFSEYLSKISIQK